jgi:hypothetical protein
MQRLTKTTVLAALACLAATVSIATAAPADLDPAATLSAGDIVRLLGGHWKSRVPEPGAIFYTELGGNREIHLYLGHADGKTIAALKQSLIASGEPVEDVRGLGTTAIYRPERNQVEVEIARKGATVWLSVIVYNVAEKTIKKSVLALAKQAAARL